MAVLLVFFLLGLVNSIQYSFVCDLAHVLCGAGVVSGVFDFLSQKKNPEILLYMTSYNLFL